MQLSQWANEDCISCLVHSASLRAGLRREEGAFFLAYPAFRLRVHSPEGGLNNVAPAALRQRRNKWQPGKEQTDTRRLRRVSPFFIVQGRRDTEARRALGRRACRVLRENSLMGMVMRLSVGGLRPALCQNRPPCSNDIQNQRGGRFFMPAQLHF
jgi:hypothetical protein